MVIVHIIPNAPYNDYWGYQDNLLPKYHKKLGHDVTVLVTDTKHGTSGIEKVECGEYDLNDGVHVIRSSVKTYFFKKITNLKSKLPVYDNLRRIKPDYIFFHGLISESIFEVIKYKKTVNPNCIIVQDNHLDYNINYERTKKGLLNFLIRLHHIHNNRKSIKYVKKVYGVTLWRKQYAEDYFRIPSEKTDILIMGADDENIDFAHKDMIRKEIRDKYNIQDNDFFVVSGGKIEKNKNIESLMKACSEIPRVKLLVFGSLSTEVKTEFEQILKENNNIIYIGWLASDKVYDYFFSADLIVFPGQHSVLWEQACASKVPCLFKRWDGMSHVDNGGNSILLDDCSVSSIKNEIKGLLYTEKYYSMKEKANSEITDVYLYGNIAKKSLECVEFKG